MEKPPKESAETAALAAVRRTSKWKAPSSPRLWCLQECYYRMEVL